MTTIPTVQQLTNNIISNLTAEFGVTTNPFGYAFIVALAGVVGAAQWLIWLAVAVLQSNLWVDTCDLPTLIRYGIIILGRNMFQAQPGVYTLTVTGTTGAVIPATTVYKSDDNSESPGMLYQITGGAYTMPGTTGTITVTALTGGLSSLLNIGDTLTATAPILNVSSTATVGAQVTAPIDAETEAAYRQAVINKIQLVPGIWSAVDYRLVGDDIDGLYQTYAYLDPASTNEVNVYLQGETPGTTISGTIITNYETAIGLVRPIGTFIINVMATPIDVFAVNIVAGTFPAFTAAQKSLIVLALQNFINNVHPFIPAADNVAFRNDTIATFNIGSVITGAVPGYGFSTVTFTVNSTTEVFYQCGTSGIGNIPYLAAGSVTFS